MTATQKTIANALGVSVATVSRGLRNDPRISAEMTGRVHRAADELGYKPNPLVAALMERVRSAKNLDFQGKIAVITDRTERSDWHHTHLTHKITYDSVKRRAEEFGYVLEDFSTLDFDPDGHRLSQILVTRGIQGILVAPGDRYQRKIALEWENFSPVTSGYSLLEPVVHRVCFAIYNAVRLVCKELTARGYKRIGLHLHASHDRITEHRYLAGYLLYQHMLPSERRIPICITEKDDKGQFLRWLDGERPDAVVSANPRVFDWICDAGLKCPDDLGFVDLDWVPEKGEIAGVYHNPEIIGAAMVEIVIALINRNERGIPRHPRRTLIDGTWVNGPTIRPAKSIESRSLAFA